MYVCKFQEGQGLGNQLWNYVSIKAIACDSNKPFGVINLDLFKGKGFIDLDCQEISDLSKFKLYKEKLYFDEANNYISSEFDNEVYSLNGDFVLQGLFQSEKYIRNHLDNLDSFLSIKKSSTISLEKKCVLNIRGGEYKKHKDFILPKSYWENAMSIMKSAHQISKFEIVTDDVNYARFLFPSLEITSGSIEECYIKIHNAEYLIVSNSSFSYFPIKTGPKPKFVVAPFKWARFNSNNNDWCSPANCYSDWHYLDNQNVLHSYNESLQFAKQTLKTYVDNNCVYDESTNKLKVSFIRKVVPSSIKTLLKRLLSFFMPSKF